MAQIPDRSASSLDVREYIVQALKLKHNADHDFAEEVSRSWRLGRGSELHDATLEYFQGLFGIEEGFCIFQSVRADQDRAWHRSLKGLACNLILLGSTAFLIWSTCMTFFSGQRRSLVPLLIMGVCQVYAYVRPSGAHLILAGGIFNIGLVLVDITRR